MSQEGLPGLCVGKALAALWAITNTAAGGGTTTPNRIMRPGLSTAYEPSVRIYDRGHSELAGMMSISLTLPTGVLLAWLTESELGVKVGDSDA